MVPNRGLGGGGKRISRQALIVTCAVAAQRRDRNPDVSQGGSEMTIALTVNGKAVSVLAEPDTPLLWVLREHLKLTGTKYGCGSGLCGACTVHIDGKATRSCQTALSQVQGKQVTTIEGLSPDSSHPLQ